MYNVECVLELGVTDSLDPRAAFRSRLSFEFMMGLLRRRYDAQVWDIEGYPGKFRLLFEPTEDFALSTNALQIREDFLQDWRLFLDAERRARSDAHFRQFCDRCFWWKWPFLRCAHCQNEIELTFGQETSFVHSARGCTEAWGDSRGADQVHLAQRTQAQKSFTQKMSGPRIYRTSIQAEVPKLRGMGCVEVQHQDAARHFRRFCNQGSIKDWFRCDDHILPEHMRKILTDDTNYDAPMASNYTKGTSAWMWLKDF